MPSLRKISPPHDLSRHLPAMTRLALRLTRDRDKADDLVQEASLNIWAHLARGHQIDDLRPYAMATVRNIARSGARRARDMVELREDTVAVSPDAPRHLACAEIRAAIERLPAAQAELLGMVAAGEASPAALARATGCKPGTVMSRLSRARAALRRDMGLGPDMSVTELY